MLLGRLEEELGNPQAADDYYRSAIRALEEIDMPVRLRDCHVEYAQVLEARGDIEAAYRQLKLAVAADKTAAVETVGEIRLGGAYAAVQRQVEPRLRLRH